MAKGETDIFYFFNNDVCVYLDLECYKNGLISFFFSGMPE